MNIPQGSRARMLTAAFAGTLVLATTAASTAATTTPPPEPTSVETPAPPFDLDPVAGELTGSGATFPAPFYLESIAELEGISPDLTIEYGGGGSGKGRTDLAEQLVDFAGTDAPVKEEDIATYKGGDFLYIPTVIAPITISYNLPDVDKLQLSPASISAIARARSSRMDSAVTEPPPDSCGLTVASWAITCYVRVAPWCRDGHDGIASLGAVVTVRARRAG